MLSSSAQQAFSDLLGYTSIACWLGAQFPCVHTVNTGNLHPDSPKIVRSWKTFVAIHAKVLLCRFSQIGLWVI